MPETTLQSVPTPLTTLTDDEILFRDNIRQFADERIRPLVKEMDEKGIFDKDLIHEFFQLGLMGIEIPEQYGGGGAKFFEAILAVEELSRRRIGGCSGGCAKHTGQQCASAMGQP
jgi:short-chain 2-methylacyl-CoA dehydrogenase